jgi:hypothetical protein
MGSSANRITYTRQWKSHLDFARAGKYKKKAGLCDAPAVKNPLEADMGQHAPYKGEYTVIFIQYEHADAAKASGAAA